jgi:hypothetical protein
MTEMYSEGPFRDNFEELIYAILKARLSKIRSAFFKMYNQRLRAKIYHNVNTLEIVGKLTDRTTFSKPLGREVDLFVKVTSPKRLFIFMSIKNSNSPIKASHVGDFADTLQKARRKVTFPILASIISRSGFQSGCEELAKDADVALVPPISGDPYWFKTLTVEDVIRKAQYMLDLALLVTLRWYSKRCYKSGDFYNEVYVVIREPSGMPRSTPVKMANGTTKIMEDLFKEVVNHELGKWVLKFGELEYIPLEKPLEVKSKDKLGRIVTSKVRAIMRRKRPSTPYIRLKTATGRELICDPQRGLYVREKGYERLYRADQLRIGMKILAYDEEADKVFDDELIEIELVDDGE